jgi:peptide-methionine (S)-S-oxide reductase
MSLLLPEKPALQKAVFGMGCFWQAEASFRKLRGVEETAVGYCGGTTKYPTYYDVCSETTGHVQAVQVRYNPAEISFRELLDTFRQALEFGQDFHIGPQYWKVIFFYDEVQREAAEQAMKGYADVEVLSAKPFYRAEEYHQRYLEKRGLVAYVI